MKTTRKTLVVLALLLCAGCGNKIDSKLNELAAKPKATTIADAKARYDEVSNLVRWHEDPAHEKMSPEQLAKAEALRDERRDQFVALGGEKLLAGVSKALESIGIKSVDPKKATDWFLGTNNTRMKKFAGPPREPTDKEGAKGWP